MLRLFLVLMIFIAATSGVLITNSYLNYQQQKNANIDQDRRNLTNIRNNLIANIIDINGIKYVPYGDNSSDYHTLPSWINIERNNVFGIPYIYCPYSSLLIGSSTNNVKLNSSQNYNVSVMNNIITKNRDYVERSSAPISENILAVIISKHDLSVNVNCNNITNTNGVFTAPKSLVSVIYYDTVLFSDIKKAEYNQINTDTDNKFMSELLQWSAYLPYKSTMELASSQTFNVAGGSIFNNSNIEKINLNIKTNLSDKAIITSSAGNQFIEFRNVDMYIENIIFSNNLKLRFINSNVKIKNSILSSLYLENSNIIFENTNINPSNSLIGNLIDAVNSKIEIKGNANFNNLKQTSALYLLNSEFFSSNNVINFSIIGSNVEVIQSINSKISLNDQNIYITGSPKIISFIANDMLSDLNLRGVNLSINNTVSGLFLSGRNSISFSNITFGVNPDFGIILNDGSVLSLNNSTIGTNLTRPNIGLRDQGGIYINGSNNTIFAANCKSGKLFQNLIEVVFNDSTAQTANISTGEITSVEVNKTVSFDLAENISNFNPNCIITP